MSTSAIIKAVPISDFIKKPDIKARCTFLLALRIGMPLFWETLHSGVWKAGRTPEALAWWLGQWCVVDEWLTAVVFDTLDYWDWEPESPDATLNPAYKWFLYRPMIQAKHKPFQFVLENPQPTRGALPFPVRDIAQLLPANLVQHPNTPDNRQNELKVALATWESEGESLEEFETRATRAFNDQLRAYISDFHRQLTFERDLETMKHAIWTAARFCGAGYMHIAETWPGLIRGISKDPEQPDKTVNVAVRRFAERIGLTLAKRR